MTWLDAASHLLAFAGGFVAWRILELVQLAGLRLRVKRERGELETELAAIRRGERLRGVFDDPAEAFDLDTDPAPDNRQRS